MVACQHLKAETAESWSSCLRVCGSPRAAGTGVVGAGTRDTARVWSRRGGAAELAQRHDDGTRSVLALGSGRSRPGR